jgi:Fe-S cluster assembly protein SufD
MSTVTEVTQETGFSREGVEALARERQDLDQVREARLKAWEVYERLPAPVRSDEEWRRTDIRGLKLNRVSPFAGIAATSYDPLTALQEAGVENAEAQIALGPNAGVVVQRDAATILSQLAQPLPRRV